MLLNWQQVNANLWLIGAQKSSDWLSADLSSFAPNFLNLKDFFKKHFRLQVILSLLQLINFSFWLIQWKKLLLAHYRLSSFAIQILRRKKFPIECGNAGNEKFVFSTDE